MKTDSLEAFCNNLKGMSLEDATEAIENFPGMHLRCRLTSKDGDRLVVTRDLRSDRINLDVMNGIITNASIG